MKYFCPKMKMSYKLYRLSKWLLSDFDSVFQQLFQCLNNNKNFKKFCDKSNFIKKNNSYILLYKFNKQLKYIDQIVLQFDVVNDKIDYDISIYCKQSTLDNKFYYPMENILNDSANTFDAKNKYLSKEIKRYFSDVFDKYFQIYEQNVDNGLFV